jgi:hypothetical protein
MNNPENIKKMKLGDILVKYGLISQEQLETALEAQKEFKTGWEELSYSSAMLLKMI